MGRSILRVEQIQGTLKTEMIYEKVIKSKR
jgi:hypothetical protein